MITALMTAAVVWCLFSGRVPPPLLVPLSAAAGAAFGAAARHGHESVLSVDALAQASRLNTVNPGLKFWSALALMCLCVASGSPVPGLFLAGAALVLTVWAGGLRLGAYLRFLSLPVSFLMMGALVLLFSVADGPAGAVNIPAFGAWLTVRAEAQAQTALVIARAFGAVSCLYLICLTTPMPELIGVLRRARCPDVVVDLMYLVYRYIFILFAMHGAMKNAAAGRLGYADFRAAYRTTGRIYANLLSRSYRVVNRNFDAMESRCYDAGIRFLEKKRGIPRAHLAATLAVAALTIALYCAFR